MFDLQPLVLLSTSSLCTPPLGPVLWAMSIAVGHLLLHQSLPHYDLHGDPSKLFRQIALQWLLGAVVLGLISGWTGYLLARIAARRVWGRAEAPLG